jgi:hypothetical protein
MSDDGRRETALRFGRGANRGSTMGNRRHRRRVDDHERLQVSVPCRKRTRNDLDRKQCAGAVDGPGTALDLEGRVATESLERLARGDGPLRTVPGETVVAGAWTTEAATGTGTGSGATPAAGDPPGMIRWDCCTTDGAVPGWRPLRREISKAIATQPIARAMNT